MQNVTIDLTTIATLLRVPRRTCDICVHRITRTTGTARYLLAGKDENGKKVYFIRVGVTGLRRRVFGPYRRKGHAIMVFDERLAVVLEAFVNRANADAGVRNHGLMIEPLDNLVTVK